MMKDQQGYSNKRDQNPSFTDRILFRGELQGLTYGANHELVVRPDRTLTSSDHRPVFGTMQWEEEEKSWRENVTFEGASHRDVLLLLNNIAFKALSTGGNNGGSERIRCRGTYRANEAGTTLSLSLRCAGDSYKFEIASDITYSGGNLSGSWNETSRQVYGSISGRATAHSIQAQASAVGFNAALAITTRGNSQSVVIRSPGSEISEVSVTMARAGR